MKYLHRLVSVASAAFFIAGTALAQNAGTVTQYAFAIGKGAGQSGYTSLLCGSAQLAVGQSAAAPICRTITGDVTITAAGATAIGATKVTSAMLNADVFSTAHSWAGQQTFVAPILGTPASGVATNLTGLPISTGVSGLGTNIAAFLATPSSANLRAALTDETGTGIAYFVGGALGTPSSATATNFTGLPLSGLTAQAAYTFVGNNSGSSAIPTAVDIAGLTAKTSPATTDLVMISDQAASGAWKKSTVAQVVGALASGVSSIAGNTGAFTLANGIDNSTNQIQLTAARRTLPTVQTFLSSSGTYTTPANVLWIEIELIGAGSGGAGGNGTASTLGGNTCWNTSGAACTTPVYQAGGAAAAPAAGTSAVGAAGGTVSGSGSCNVLSVSGGNGDSATLSVSGVNAGKGGMGGSSSIGGNGGGGNNATGVGSNAKTNSGSGGGGGGQGGATSAQGGSGGAAGATCRVILGSPAASYTYAVGAGGNGGTGGTSGANGGDGAAGHIVVIEHYGT